MAPCRLRRLTEDDVPMILPWRNDPDVRRFMYTQHEISPQEHADFFARALRDTTRAYYLGLDDEEPVGGSRCVTSMRTKGPRRGASTCVHGCRGVPVDAC